MPGRNGSSSESFFLDAAALLCLDQAEICLEQAPHSLMGAEIMVICAEEGDESVEGPGFNPHQAQGALDVELV